MEAVFTEMGGAGRVRSLSLAGVISWGASWTCQASGIIWMGSAKALGPRTPARPSSAGLGEPGTGFHRCYLRILRARPGWGTRR